METIDYKEKYNEALERARAIHNEHKAQPHNIMGEVFPELTEREDERIRKSLVALIKEIKLQPLKRLEDWDGMLAYLEKQKEQKSKVERDIAQPVEQDGTSEPDYGICDNSVPGNLSAALRRHGWYLGHVGENQQYVEARKEDVKRNWPADRDSLTQEKDLIMANSPQLEQKPTEWSEQDKHNLNSVINLVHSTSDGAWGSCVGDRIGNWLKSLPERFNLQPKR